MQCDDDVSLCHLLHVKDTDHFSVCVGNPRFDTAATVQLQFEEAVANPELVDEVAPMPRPAINQLA